MQNIVKDINSVPYPPGSSTGCSLQEPQCDAIGCAMTLNGINTVMNITLLECNNPPGVHIEVGLQSSSMGFDQKFTHLDTAYFLNTPEIKAGLIVNITHSEDSTFLGLSVSKNVVLDCSNHLSILLSLDIHKKYYTSMSYIVDITITCYCTCTCTYVMITFGAVGIVGSVFAIMSLCITNLSQHGTPNTLGPRSKQCRSYNSANVSIVVRSIVVR